MICRRDHHLATMFAAALFLQRLPPSVDGLASPKLHTPCETNRRGALGRIASLATGVAGLGLDPEASFAESKSPQLESPLSSSSPPSPSPLSSPSATPKEAADFAAYTIIPDETAVRSRLDKIDSNTFLNSLASPRAGGSIWLGEHHNSAPDHNFQASFIRRIHEERQRRSLHQPMAIGLEQVQNQFQPILDGYLGGKFSLDHMRFMVQWDKRWTWSFENYKKIFETARELNIRLVALNVDSEDLSLVEKEGYPGLPTKRLRKYIKDP
jgi:Haem-binding uptake, Tiki superfamily, ChaN